MEAKKTRRAAVRVGVRANWMPSARKPMPRTSAAEKYRTSNFPAMDGRSETLSFTSKVANLEVKESRALGTMLVITSESTYLDSAGDIVFTTRGQGIFY